MGELSDCVLVSRYLHKLKFPLFNLIRPDLWSYLLTIQDINFLLEVDSCINWATVQEMWFGEYILKLFEMDEKLLKQHCDPYELFIDSWWITPNLKVARKSS